LDVLANLKQVPGSKFYTAVNIGSLAKGEIGLNRHTDAEDEGILWLVGGGSVFRALLSICRRRVLLV
jgi:hypothetical protein